MAEGRGNPLFGDRSAHDVTDATYHASDIEDAALTRHLPAPDADGNYARDDGNNWLAQSGLPIVDLNGYVQGYIIRGGAGDWEAYDATGARQVLIGDGADIVSRVLANADLPDPFAFANAESILTLNADAITVTQTVHVVAAQAGVADDLATINGAVTRQLLLLKADAGDTITVQHGVGNIHFDSGVDFTLAGDSWLLFFYDGTNAVAIGAGGGGVDASDVTYTPSDDSDWDGDVDPGNVDDALDQLACRTHVLERGEMHLLFSQVEDVTVTNTTDETSVLGSGRGSKTLTAFTLDVGTVVRLTLYGHFSDTGTPTLDVKVELGGTEVCSIGVVTLLSGIDELGWSLNVDFVCRTTGDPGTVVAAGIFEYNDNSGHRMTKTGTTNIDTTAELLVDVTATWGAAAAGNTITCQMATIEILRADALAPAAPTELTAVEV